MSLSPLLPSFLLLPSSLRNLCFVAVLFCCSVGRGAIGWGVLEAIVNSHVTVQDHVTKRSPMLNLMPVRTK